MLALFYEWQTLQTAPHRYLPLFCLQIYIYSPPLSYNLRVRPDSSVFSSTDWQTSMQKLILLR